MRNEILVIVLLVVLAAAILYYTRQENSREGFETILDKVQDRANPLAAGVNPLRNPHATYGISESSGADLRNLNLSALNQPIQLPTNTADIRQMDQMVRLSPRIDNENSLLGIVKFCKETAETHKNPFANAEFRKYCGVCMSSGSWITGETFTERANEGRGVGVVVYEKDKERAYDKQGRNQFKYPRAMPSLEAATCSGTNLNDDSAPPVLAIDGKMYWDILKRNECRDGTGDYRDRQCGRCRTEGDPLWSYVKFPVGGVQPDSSFLDKDGKPFVAKGNIKHIYLDLYGSGKVTLKVGGEPIKVGGKDENDLSRDKPLTYDLADNPETFIKEGTQFTIEVRQGAARYDIYVAGELYGSAAPGEIVRHQDLGAGLVVNRRAQGENTPTSVDSFPLGSRILTKWKPRQNARITAADIVKLRIIGFVPMTFIDDSYNEDSTQIAYYDCQNNFYVTSAESERALNFTDECSVDEAENAPLSDGCLQTLLAAAGCSTAGGWRRDPQTLLTEVGGGKRKADVVKFLEQKLNSSQTPAEKKRLDSKCYGIDTSSACDAYIDNPTAVPDEACLQEIYSNQLTENKRLQEQQAGGKVGVAKVYDTESFMNYRSLNINTDEFCRPDGKLNPSTANGLAELQRVARDGNGGTKRGLDAVKEYLTEQYNLAINQSKDIHTDSLRKAAWENCFGTPIRAPVVRSMNVDLPSELQLAENRTGSYRSQAIGLPVYVNENAWVGSGVTWNGDWTPHAPPRSAGCFWIWGEPGYVTRASTGVPFTFRFNYFNTFMREVKAYVVGALDDFGSVKINNRVVFNSTAPGVIRNPIEVTLPWSRSEPIEIEVTCTSGGGPAGIWLAMYVEERPGTKQYVVVTNNRWTYTRPS